jgi:hypothetical protein
MHALGYPALVHIPMELLRAGVGSKEAVKGMLLTLRKGKTDRCFASSPTQSRMRHQVRPPVSLALTGGG